LSASTAVEAGIVRLKSLTLAGFKSFPERTRLDFGPGVSVVVGPNGSGKSNITDAVLWALGEQSPLAVRGASMQDVIFAGGRGVQPRAKAEVEIVLDNSDGAVEVPMSEISIVRRLDRNGEGGYWLNGARCRLTDVIETLSDTGLGKETHSVISQGRVDAIVTSKPRGRRMLIEEAAGLGKHRKRRRRAQLKLERTQENVDRVLDIEREARLRLRPLKRQAEAARLHERLELQILHARRELATDRLRGRREELGEAEALAAQARERLAVVESELQATLEARRGAERALEERAARREELSRRRYEARAAAERIELRREQIAERSRELTARSERAALELRAVEDRQAASGDRAGGADAAGERIAELLQALAELDAQREQGIEDELSELSGALERDRALREQLAEQTARAREQAAHLAGQAEAARERLAGAEQRARDARRERERVAAELAAVNQFLRDHARAGGDQEGGPTALSEALRVRDGYELALAAVLGGRLDAALVEGLPRAQELLDRVGPDGGTVLLSHTAEGAAAGAETEQEPPSEAPARGARRLLELVDAPDHVRGLARRLLADAWVVERLEDIPAGFAGIAVTRAGRVWFATPGELRQLTEGGSELVLARRNERDRLLQALDAAQAAEQGARETAERALAALAETEAGAAAAARGLREHEQRHAEGEEAERRTRWLIEQRRAAPAHGPLAVRKAQLEGELAAERRQQAAAEKERSEREARLGRLRARHALDESLIASARRLDAALELAASSVLSLLASIEQQLDADRLAGEQGSGELTAFAAREAEIQSKLKAASLSVTDAEVAAQRMRDRAGEAEIELTAVLARLGADAAGPVEGDLPEALSEEAIAALDERVERLERRRAQLGPVNPLAQDEYAEALAHVEELEHQRGDLETAMRELRSLIRETDRQIEETFEQTFSAAARNFQELVGEIFPGGSGALRLVADDASPRGVLGGQPLPREDADPEAAEAAADAELEAEREPEQNLPGVEIEITPAAGKATKRLTLLSGGEKSMTALAFLFAVFLAKPCPFYILDEVEAALDDLNLDRFLALLRRYCGRAQFIVITHQKRTMEAADWLYGVSMGQNGVSKVVSRHLEFHRGQIPEVAEVA
jgi:chromosome segregation protein